MLILANKNSRRSAILNLIDLIFGVNMYLGYLNVHTKSQNDCSMYDENVAKKLLKFTDKAYAMLQLVWQK